MERERLRASGYTPPPPTLPPPAGWRPPQIVIQAPPRQLPHQDHTAIDQAEESARAVTRTTGIIAAVLLIGLMVVLCARLIF
jgi:hypothetical protein